MVEKVDEEMGEESQNSLKTDYVEIARELAANTLKMREKAFRKLHGMLFDK